MNVPSAATEPRQPRGRHPFLPQPVPGAEIQRLLHAVFAAKRPASWGRAAPPPLCWHAFSIYALTPEGSWRYDPHADALDAVAEGDVRDQLELAGAPLTLVCVADLDPRHAHAEEHGVCAGADAGCIAGEVGHDCGRRGLTSVVHGPVTRTRLGRALGLAPTQRVVLAQSIGHAMQTAPH